MRKLFILFICLLTAAFMYSCVPDSDSELDPAGDEDGDGLTNGEEEEGWTIEIDLNGDGDFEDVNEEIIVTSDPLIVDTDSDGLDDAQEKNFSKSHPRLKDTDSDGLDDAEEINIYGSSAFKSDSDGDSQGDSKLFDGAEILLYGTSPTLTDTDGDRLGQVEDGEGNITIASDWYEINNAGFNPCVADIPKLDLNIATDPTVVLNVTFETGTGTEDQSYQATLSSDTTDLENTNASSNSNTIENSQAISVEVESDISWDPSASIKIEAEANFTQASTNEQSYSTTQAASQTAQQEYNQYLTQNSTYSEEASDGTISVGFNVINTGNVTFTLNSLQITALKRDLTDPDSMKVYTTLEPTIQNGEFTISPGSETGVLQISDSEVNATLVKELLQSPESLFFDVAYFELLNEDGGNYSYIAQDVNSKTGMLVIDYGGAEPVERYAVATNVYRTENGTPAGVTMKKALEDILEIPYEINTNNNNLKKVRSVETHPTDPKTQGFWVIMTSSESLDIDPDTPFEDIVMKNGDVVELVYVKDFDGDKLYNREEAVYGTNILSADTDGDGLTDFEEVKGGWTAEYPGDNYQVYSSPINANIDGDEYTDLEEFYNKTNPNKVDYEIWLDPDILTGHTNNIKSIDFNHDGTMIVSGSDDHTARIWEYDGTDWSSTHTLNHTEDVNSVDFNHDDTKIVSGCEDSIVHIWEYDGTDWNNNHNLTDTVMTAKFSNDSTKIVSGGVDGNVRIWEYDGTNWNNNHDLTGHTNPVMSVDFNHDGTMIVSGGVDATVRIWEYDGTDWSNNHTLTGHTNPVMSVDFNHDGTKIVSGSDDDTVRIWEYDGTDWSNNHTLTDHNRLVRAVDFNYNGSQIVSTDEDDTYLWYFDGESWINKKTLEYDANTYDVTFDNTGRKIAAVDNGTNIRILENYFSHVPHPELTSISPVSAEIGSSNVEITLTGTGMDYVTEVSIGNVTESTFTSQTDTELVVTLDLSSLVIGTYDVKVTDGIKISTLTNGFEITPDTGTWNNIYDLTEHTSTVMSVDFNHDGTQIVSGGYDFTIKVWDCNESSGTIADTLTGHTNIVKSVAFNHDGTKIVSGSCDNTIKIWNWNGYSGTLAQTLTDHTDFVNSVAFNHDSTKIVSGSEDYTIKVWERNGSSYEHAQTLTDHTNIVMSVAFNHDGTQIVSGSTDNTVKVWKWDGSSYAIEHTFTYTNGIYSVAFNHNGTQIAAGSNIIKVWNWNGYAGVLADTLTGDITQGIATLAFNHDGTQIISCGSAGEPGNFYGNINVWDWDGSTGTLQTTLTNISEYGVYSVAYNHDETRFVSGDYSNIVKVWEWEWNY